MRVARRTLKRERKWILAGMVCKTKQQQNRTKIWIFLSTKEETKRK